MKKNIQFLERWVRNFNDFTAHIFDKITFVSGTGDEANLIMSVEVWIGKVKFQAPYADDPRYSASFALQSVARMIRNFSSAIAIMKKQAEEVNNLELAIKDYELRIKNFLEKKNEG